MLRLTSLCVRRPWATVLVTLALTAVATWSAVRTDSAVGTDANLGADHPAVRTFSDFLDRFGGGYPILVAFECADPRVCDTALDEAALLMTSTVSKELLHASSVSRVSSPGSSRFLMVDVETGLTAQQLVVDDVAVENANLKKLALEDPLWRRTLVSENGRVGAIAVELSSTESHALARVIREIRHSIKPFEESFRFHIVGEAAMSVAAQEAGLESAVRAGAGTGGMLFLSLLVLLRSLSSVLASLATIGVASAWTIGLLPLLGWQQSELTNGAATLILVIGAADCVHFVAHYLENRSQFGDDATALLTTARSVLAPCLLTTATTVGAFATFATGGVLALTQFGVMAAIGIAFAFLLTFSLFPALLILAPPKPRSERHSVGWQEVLARIARFGTERRRPVLGLALLLGIVGAAGIPKLRVEMDISALWGPDHPVTRGIDFVSTHLQRADRLEVDVELGPDVLLEDPSVLRVLASVETEIGALEGIGRAQSLVTVLRHTNHMLRPDTTQAGDLPATEGAAAELLFLMSAGAPGTLDPWLTVDQRHVRLSFEVHDLSMQETTQLIARVHEQIRNLLPPGWAATVTGPVALTSEYGIEFSRSQATIVSWSSLIVFLMIGLYLRSLPWALLAVIPNAVALLLLFGAMGHWGMPLNFGSAIVAPIAIGIAADDTIHFLTAYARERRSGSEPLLALQGAISGVGEAVIATAIALSLGFLSIMASPLASVADMGLLCAVAILAATAADLLLLPALIATVAGWRRFDRLPERHG